MSKHTPGPWAVSPSLSRDIIAPGNGELLATTYWIGKPWEEAPEGEAEARANARLIAAAPELLEACRRMMQLAVSTDGDEVFAQVRAAISKAESKS